MNERREGSRRADGRSTRWAGQHQRRRAEFVEAALIAIARHGADTSTEQIAEQAGVARTRLYKHFAGATDLQRAIAWRAAEMITLELAPVWNPDGSPSEVIGTGVQTHLRWLTEHRELYLYLSRHSLTATGGDAIRDIKDTIGGHLTQLFGAYLTAFGVESGVAEPLAYGIVGLVETATTRWLEQPAGVRQEELAENLSRWIWLLLDDTLRERGITLSPDQPLASPQVIADDARSYQSDESPESIPN